MTYWVDNLYLCRLSNEFYRLRERFRSNMDFFCLTYMIHYNLLRGAEVNLVVVSHGTLCEGLVSAFRMMVSSSCPITAVGLDDSGVDDFRRRLVDVVEGTLANKDVLIMSDIIGGTPYNESFALFLQHPERIRVVAGTNFPMLVEVGIAAADCDDLDEAAAIALEAGRQGVSLAAVPSDEPDDEDLF